MRGGVARSVADSLGSDTCWYWVMKSVEAHSKLMKLDPASAPVRNTQQNYLREINDVDVTDPHEVRSWWAVLIIRAYDGVDGWGKNLEDIPAPVLEWADNAVNTDGRVRPPRFATDDEATDDNEDNGDGDHTSDDDAKKKKKRKPSSKPKPAKPAKQTKKAVKATDKGVLSRVSACPHVLGFVLPNSLQHSVRVNVQRCHPPEVSGAASGSQLAPGQPTWRRHVPS